MIKENVLIIGSGGREHALGWKIQQSTMVGQIYFAPGNAGTERLGENNNISTTDIEELVRLAKEKNISLTVVGSEIPLEAGIVDRFREHNLHIFGPTREAARLETDKAWAIIFMERHNIPHPETLIVNNAVDALNYGRWGEVGRSVIKASGLAGGKGVLLPETFEELKVAISKIMEQKEFGNAGKVVLLQERLKGREVSVLAITDGERFKVLPPAQDHKRIYDGNIGPNTGGMGAFAPVPWMTAENIQEVAETIIKPTILGMRRENIPFQGVLYAGLMITKDGPKVLEYNVRFGDPETQAIMMLLEGDFYKTLKAASLGKLDERILSIRSGTSCCVVLASGGYPDDYNKGYKIVGLDKDFGENIQIFHAGTIRRGNDIITNGGRVLGVTAYSESLEKAIAKSYEAIGESRINFKNMHFRRDIGHQKLER